MKLNQWNQNGEGSTWPRSGTVVHDLRFTFWYVNSIIEPLPMRNELTPGGRRSRLPELTAGWPSKIASSRADCRMAVEDRDRQMSDPHWFQHRPVRGSDTKWVLTMALLDFGSGIFPVDWGDPGGHLLAPWWHRAPITLVHMVDRWVSSLGLARAAGSGPLTPKRAKVGRGPARTAGHLLNRRMPMESGHTGD